MFIRYLQTQSRIKVMGVNMQLSPEERKLTYIGQITRALESIASSLSYEFGPMKPQKMINPSDEFAEQAKEHDEAQSREIEIQELKRANKISAMTAQIAVIGLVLSALIGVFQLMLDWFQFMRK